MELQGNHYYFLIRELLLKNYEIFRLMEKKYVTENYGGEEECQGFIIFEDCRRKPSLELDYPHLKMIFNTQEEFEENSSMHNTIRHVVLLKKELTELEKLMLYHVVEGLVGRKGNVGGHETITVLGEQIIEELIEGISVFGEQFKGYTELLKYTEGKPNVSHYSEELLLHLFQEDPHE